MGSRGLSKLKGLFLGSVSHKVFHLAPCSCVTVHHTDEQPALAGIKTILVPTDGSDQADKAVDIASDIAVKYGANLVIEYVMWRGPSLEKLRNSVNLDQLSASARDELNPELHPVAEHVSSTFIPPVISKDTSREIGEQVLARGRQSAEAKGVRAPKLVLLDGDPARTIVGTAQREQADLIAMGSRGLGGSEGLLVGSVSYKVSHAVHCSCMIVR
jgi:nucleotide-binding universal stress UspA family protein